MEYHLFIEKHMVFVKNILNIFYMSQKENLENKENLEK
jgi:hypothetical protein